MGSIKKFLDCRAVDESHPVDESRAQIRDPFTQAKSAIPKIVYPYLREDTLTNRDPERNQELET
jgi:hypothetical protein